MILISKHDFNYQTRGPGKTKPFISSNEAINIQFLNSFLSVKEFGICYHCFNYRLSITTLNWSPSTAL